MKGSSKGRHGGIPKMDAMKPEEFVRKGKQEGRTNSGIGLLGVGIAPAGRRTRGGEASRKDERREGLSQRAQHRLSSGSRRPIGQSPQLRHRRWEPSGRRRCRRREIIGTSGLKRLLHAPNPRSRRSQSSKACDHGSGISVFAHFLFSFGV